MGRATHASSRDLARHRAHHGDASARAVGVGRRAGDGAVARRRHRARARAVDARTAGLPELLGVDAVAAAGRHGRRRPAPRAWRGALDRPRPPRHARRSRSPTTASCVHARRTGPEIRLGEPTQVGGKARAAWRVLGALGGAAVAYIDVSVPANPVAG